jgi:hypothetical protein
MATSKKNGGAEDASARRLLDAIGAAELDYFSAAGERAIGEALESWPLLAATARTLRVERDAGEARARRLNAADRADPPLRVVETAGDPLSEDPLIEES